MAEITDAEVGEIDLAIVAYRDEGDWNLAKLPDRSLDDIDTISKELRRYPGENGAMALISVAGGVAYVLSGRRWLRVRVSGPAAGGHVRHWRLLLRRLPRHN